MNQITGLDRVVESVPDPRRMVDMWQMYLKGKSWRCKKSPTKAHHWVETTHGGESSIFTCKYCEETRKMRNTWSGVMAEVSKKLKKGRAMDISIKSEETIKNETEASKNEP